MKRVFQRASPFDHKKAKHPPGSLIKIGIAGVCIVIFSLFLKPGFTQTLNNFKPGSEPEGFGNIAWETNLNAFENMEFTRQDPSYGGIDVYRKKKNECEICGVGVKNIDFLFWKGKFCGICFFVDDFSGYEQFKDAVSRKFGVGKKAFPNQEYHLWEGKKTLMSLEYKPSERSILFLMLSISVLSQMEERER